MPGEVVHRDVHAASIPERLHVLHEQIGLERVRVVVVEGRAFFEAQIVAIPVIAIVFQHHDLAVADALDDTADDRGFAGSGTSGDTDDEGLGCRGHAR